MLFICYEKCTTCKGVEKSLLAKGISFEKRDIKAENPTAAELKQWHQQSGVELKKFFNTSGIIYRENNLKDKIGDMTEEEQYELLATDGMLVKRPILITDDEEVFVGPTVKAYIEEYE